MTVIYTTLGFFLLQKKNSWATFCYVAPGQIRNIALSLMPTGLTETVLKTPKWRNWGGRKTQNIIIQRPSLLGKQ